MSGLLKEALKSLCGLNHWSYAVFWKFGCQNSKLLIWEEHYYEPLWSSALPCISELRNPELPFGEWDGCRGSETSAQLRSRPSAKVDLLVNKMMSNNRMKIVGQGLVGRAAFTGNHQWILAKNHITDAEPPEVLDEVHLQFSAGMQTVVVIPVLPRGVIQLGSSVSITENPGFVTEVKSLVLSLVQPPSVDDLFDVLGEDLKSRLLIGKWNNVSDDGPDIKTHNAGAAMQTDTNMSCGTTLNKFGSSSTPSSSTAFGVGEVNISNTWSQTSIYGPRAGSWFEPCRNSRCDISVLTPYARRIDETTKPNRRRLKPRPRPKDRQMILDRVNELREIVPNGTNCSIDTLLGKTVKHMLFLQSITKNSDNLKLTGESKIKEDLDGGATWAFEVGSQSTISPIVVEDLNPPRQMLVEMLFEERGFFLEIADLIRGLGLTILKGVMETRKNKIRARFAVEADRDVTRVEIFMLLARLLDRTAKCGTLPADTTVRHSFPPAAAVRATGGGR